MLEDDRGNIFEEKLSFLNICMLSNKINILIIGGGRGALTKLRGLIKKDVNVTILAKEIIDDIRKIKYEKLILIEDEYKKTYIMNKHFIIIAVDNDDLRRKIKFDLEEEFKLYLDASNFKEGNSIIPMSGEEKGINISLNTASGNPKGSKFLYNKFKGILLEYGNFIEYTTLIRNLIKDREDSIEILNFLISDDFKFYFDKGKQDLVLELFYENIFR